MNEHEISTPDDLNAVLAGNEMRRTEELWQAADGRTYRWVDVLILVLGSASILMGVYGVTVREDLGAMMLLVLGAAMVAGIVHRQQQAQISALRELLQRSQRR